MTATQEEMVEARVPLAYRDQCAHLLIPLNKCRQAEDYLPWKCDDERHPYKNCEDELVMERMLKMQKIREEEAKLKQGHKQPAIPFIPKPTNASSSSSFLSPSQREPVELLGVHLSGSQKKEEEKNAKKREPETEFWDFVGFLEEAKKKKEERPVRKLSGSIRELKKKRKQRGELFQEREGESSSLSSRGKENGLVWRRTSRFNGAAARRAGSDGLAARPAGPDKARRQPVVRGHPRKSLGLR